MWNVHPQVSPGCHFILKRKHSIDLLADDDLPFKTLFIPILNVVHAKSDKHKCCQEYKELGIFIHTTDGSW